MGQGDGYVAGTEDIAPRLRAGSEFLNGPLLSVSASEEAAFGIDRVGTEVSIFLVARVESVCSAATGH